MAIRVVTVNGGELKAEDHQALNRAMTALNEAEVLHSADSNNIAYAHKTSNKQITVNKGYYLVCGILINSDSNTVFDFTGNGGVTSHEIYLKFELPSYDVSIITVPQTTYPTNPDFTKVNTGIFYFRLLRFDLDATGTISNETLRAYPRYDRNISEFKDLKSTIGLGGNCSMIVDTSLFIINNGNNFTLNQSYPQVIPVTNKYGKLESVGSAIRFKKGFKYIVEVDCNVYTGSANFSLYGSGNLLSNINRAGGRPESNSGLGYIDLRNATSDQYYSLVNVWTDGANIVNPSVSRVLVYTILSNELNHIQTDV